MQMIISRSKTTTKGSAGGESTDAIRIRKPACPNHLCTVGIKNNTIAIHAANALLSAGFTLHQCQFALIQPVSMCIGIVGLGVEIGRAHV